jgi:NCAIR mutase (PurE)-related protein
MIPTIKRIAPLPRMTAIITDSLSVSYESVDLEHVAKCIVLSTASIQTHSGNGSDWLVVTAGTNEIPVEMIVKGTVVSFPSRPV